MRKILLLLLLILNQFCFSQNWERVLGLSNRQEVFSHIAESYDRGYLILGRLNDYPDSRSWIVKTDINGNILYDFILGTGMGVSQRNIPECLLSTQDGGFIVSGSFTNTGSTDIGIMKFDPCGNLEWCLHFANPDIAWGQKIIQTPDGGYTMLAHGFERYPSITKSDLSLFRLDANGNILWIQPYAERIIHPLISDSHGNDFIITSDGDYYIVGSCGWIDTVSGASITKGIIIGADSLRNEKWISILTGEEFEGYISIASLVEKNTGNFYLGSGYTNGNTNPTLLIADSLGVILLDSIPLIPDFGEYVPSNNLFGLTFFNDDRLFTMTQMSDHPFGITGCIAIHELDTLGGWVNSFIETEATWPFAFVKTSDDRFLIGATSLEYQDIILIKLTDSLKYDTQYPFALDHDYLCPEPIVSKTIDLSSCEVIVDVKDIPTRKEYEARVSLIPITPAPNPAGDYVRFLLENTEYHSKIRVVCYDIQGRQLAELPVNSGIHETGLDVSRWRPGMYMAVVYAGNKQMGKARFVVE
ncbi:protein containing Por secretion system C-terminal sorting domain [Lentimicrobium saccharophilum]|uniref:Protein containing Por secretion system C-terminal sorting domain n=1 Tax=Lentimicrobium saccharophilum TaxID=1678841 RepID=A0A0S7BWA3_9BACT|nr:T9SS type A sorting domain-containing protein [Lentimicrobium saccharophilum]GAP42046.1 protein containing Por secretion system C-terminal sorting domain [Lentimicrobium saccharophilum]